MLVQILLEYLSASENLEGREEEGSYILCVFPPDAGEKRKANERQYYPKKECIAS